MPRIPPVVSSRSRSELHVVTTRRSLLGAGWLAGALLGGAGACSPTAPHPKATFDLRITLSSATVASGDSVRMNVALARTSDRLLPSFLGRLSVNFEAPSGMEARADVATCWGHTQDPGWLMPSGYDSYGCTYVVTVARTVTPGRYDIVVTATPEDFVPRRETLTITVTAPAPSTR